MNFTKFSAKEVTEIIMACSRAKVVQFEYRGLSLNFGPPKKQLTKNFEIDDFGKPVVPNDPENENTVAERSLLTDELRIRDEQAATALVEDPALYEEIMIREAEEEAQPPKH